jgi:hypothetical protein
MHEKPGQKLFYVMLMDESAKELKTLIIEFLVGNLS